MEGIDVAMGYKAPASSQHRAGEETRQGRVAHVSGFFSQTLEDRFAIRSTTGIELEVDSVENDFPLVFC